MWENLGVFEGSKPIRSCFVYLFFFLMLVGSLLGLLMTADYQDRILSDPNEFKILYACDDTTSKEYAYAEYLEDPPLTGPMSCYCQAQVLSMGLQALKITFGDEEEEICMAWSISFGK